MNLNGLTPEQIKLIVTLNKRIEMLESKLGNLQEKVVRVDRILAEDLAKQITHLNLN